MKISSIILYLLLSSASFQAIADIVVIVSNQNPVDSISENTISKIFLGKLKLFPDGSTAIPLDLPETSEDKEIFYKKGIGKTANQLKAYWSRVIFTGSGSPPRVIDTDAEIVDIVSKNPNTIGYVSKSAVNNNVKVVMEIQ